MINFKTITIEQLKEEHKDSLGFVFQASSPSSDDAVERLCNLLIQTSITVKYPEFVSRLPNNITVFVYDHNFNGPLFIQKAMLANHLGICTVDTLFNFIKQYETSINNG